MIKKIRLPWFTYVELTFYVTTFLAALFILLTEGNSMMWLVMSAMLLCGVGDALTGHQYQQQKDAKDDLFRHLAEKPE